MKRSMLSLICTLLLLTGCAPLLQREYSTAEPHSSKFWESEAAGTLRAENHQDIVNDLLLLIGQHTETATIRLYNYEDELTVADMLEQATVEIQQETPMGAYAVEYITSSRQAQRGYYEISVQIGYRRTAEQLQAVLNATSPEAVYSLLETALDSGRTELAVRIGYWSQDGKETVSNAIAQLREERGLSESPMWLVQYYPADGPVGLVEFLLDPPDPPENPPDAGTEGEEALPGGTEPPSEETADEAAPPAEDAQGAEGSPVPAPVPDAAPEETAESPDETTEAPQNAEADNEILEQGS